MHISRKFKRHKDLMVIGFYTLITLILTYPVAFQLTSHIAGFEGEDNLQWRWFLWWFKHSLLTLQNPVIELPLLYAPTGGEQPFYAISVFVPAVALPITLFTNPTTSFNLSFLVAFILSGYTAYLLGYYLTHNSWAGFICGLIFTFYPARFGYATGTFLGQITVYLLPLYVLSLLMLAQRPTRRRAIWAVVLLVCLCLTWPLHVAYGVVVFTVAILCWQGMVWWREPKTRAHIMYYALIFSVSFVIILPAYLPLLQGFLEGQSRHLSKDSLKFSVDILAFVAPSNYHPLLKPLNLLPAYATQVLADRDDIQERLVYLGIIPMMLAVLGVIVYRHKLWLWLSIALTTMLLSLGSLLKVGGQVFQMNVDGYVGYVILPYAFLRALPILNWSETLGRLTVPTMLCLAILTAHGVAYLLTKTKPTWRLSVVSLLSLLILLEYITIFPFPTEADTVPAFYHQLGQEGQHTPQMIIDLPLEGEPIYNNYAMHYQTVHHQALAGGHFIRKPAGAVQMRGFINQLLSPPITQTAFVYPSAAERQTWLNQAGFTKIVVRPWLMTTDPSATQQLTYLATWLGQPQPHGDVAVFELSKTDMIDTIDTPSQPIISLLSGGGWQATEAGLQLNAPAELWVEVDDTRPQQLVLQLSAPAADRYLSIEIDGQTAIRLYLAQDQLTYRLPLQLSVGVHQLTFWPEERCSQSCESVNFNQIAWSFTKSEPSKPISFEHQLTLLRHEVSDTTVVVGQPILISLYWQNQQRLTEDYSAFVHLVAPSGEVVAQADYLLGGWLYPTSQWATAHLTSVPTLFFVPPSTPAGDYQLLTGLYHSTTGERLSVGPTAVERSDAVVVETLTIRTQ